MVRSMTGFGRASVSEDGRELTLELKSVNHRFLDIAFRMPRSLSFLEDTVRGALGSAVARGHFDVFAFYRNTRSDSKTVSLDKTLLSAYISTAAAASEEFAELYVDVWLQKFIAVRDDAFERFTVCFVSQ